MTNGWTSMALTSWLPQPAKDHYWLASAPTTHWPCMSSATAAGPAHHLPLPSSESVAVGKVKVGPTPQMSLPDLAGEKKDEGLMSLRPEAFGMPARARAG